MERKKEVNSLIKGQYFENTGSFSGGEGSYGKFKGKIITRVRNSSFAGDKNLTGEIGEVRAGWGLFEI